jgi:hypothetical protein
MKVIILALLLASCAPATAPTTYDVATLGCDVLLRADALALADLTHVPVTAVRDAQAVCRAAQGVAGTPGY